MYRERNSKCKMDRCSRISSISSIISRKKKSKERNIIIRPPGNGKSFLAQTAATETREQLFRISTAKIIGKWLGESENLIKELFILARKIFLL